MSRRAIYCLSFQLLVSLVFSQTDSQIRNIKAFTKLFGYVKYFHPSDEAANLDWNEFAVHGAKMVENINSDDSLILMLERLFQPIAPTVIISKSKIDKKQISRSITPMDTSGFSIIAWQHIGDGLDAIIPKSTYKSQRINKSFIIDKGTSDFGNSFFTIQAKKFLKSRIKLTGVVKVNNPFIGSGHLWLRVDNSNGGVSFFNNMKENPIKNTSWTKYEIIGEVGENASRINFGCFLKGKGELWLDDMKVFYENEGIWQPIKYAANDFENVNLSENGWKFKGKYYTFASDSNEYFNGKRSLSIKYTGDLVEISEAPALFEKIPAIGETIYESIEEKINLGIPLALYGDKNGTYPKSEPISLYKLHESIDHTIKLHNEFYFHLADIIVTWNAFQHFYPYFEEDQINWESELEIALTKAYSCDPENYSNNLMEFVSKVKDGHITIDTPNSTPYFPKISLELVNDTLVVSEVLDSRINIQVGSVVEEINREKANDYIQNCKKFVPTANESWGKYQIINYLLKGKKNSLITLKCTNSSQISLSRTISKREHFEKRKKTPYKKLNDSLMYVDLSVIQMETIDSLFPTLRGMKNIICDLREYPANNLDFLSYLLKNDDTIKWMATPEIIYPDQKGKIGYRKAGWNLRKKPQHINANLMFLIGGKTISYGESYVGIIKGYSLGTLIGEQTAGTNGNVNAIILPSGTRVTFTGMKVFKLNGDPQHRVGFTPDIVIKRSIEGIKLGRDDVLEYAIESTKKNKD